MIDGDLSAARRMSASISRHVFRVVLTGGPCGGKSSALAHMQRRAQGEHKAVLVVPECPTILFQGGVAYPKAAAEQEGFQRVLCRLQMDVEDAFGAFATEERRPTLVVMDRGIYDVRAYVGPDAFSRVLQWNHTTEAAVLQRYDMVLHLVTAANGAQDHYKFGHTVDDSGRFVYRREDLAAARDVDDRLIRAWSAHPKHVVIDNGFASFAEKMEAATTVVMTAMDRSSAASKV